MNTITRIICLPGRASRIGLASTRRTRIGEIDIARQISF